MSTNKFYHLSDLLEPLNDFKEVGNTKGLNTGIVALNEYITLKKGFPLFIAGAPFSGKTEFCFEVLVNTSILHGWKHFVYCGEGGEPENIVSELMHKFIGKPFVKGDYSMTKEEETKATAFVMKHFIIANHDHEFTINEFYSCVDEAESQYNIKFDTVTFDPFNDIKEEIEYFGGREDKYLASVLKTCRVNAKKYNRINILVNHIADVRAITDSEGNRFMPPALPNEWSGGRTWWRRAFTMILVYRPQKFQKNIHGVNALENETWIITQKSKPKGVGKNGTASIFYDWKKNRFYSYDNTGQQLYSCETKEQMIFKPLVENREFLNDNDNVYF
jgi:hypothetical protein